MKATLNGRVKQANWRSMDAGIDKTYLVLGIDDGGKPAIASEASIRYSSSGATCFASFRANKPDGSDSIGNTGNVGGGGYHMGSASISKAFDNEGVELDFNINGVGDSAVYKALIAIAIAMGWDESTLSVSL
jgi:hypothetical protein